MRAPKKLHLIRMAWVLCTGFAFLSVLLYPACLHAQWSASFRVSNQLQVSPSIYEFDVYLQNTSSQTLRLHSYQFGLGVDTSIIAGGNLQVQYIDGSCQLSNPSQAPFWQFDSSTGSVFTNINFGHSIQLIAGRYYRFINCTAALPPIFTQASLVPVTIVGCPQPGIRIGRFRVVNSVPFGRSTRPFHVFSEVNAAGVTRSVISLFLSPSTQQFLYPNATINTLGLINWNSIGSCDVNTIFNCRDSATISATICAPDSFWMGGVAYTTSGNYQVNLLNSSGCDSFVALTLSVSTPTSAGILTVLDSMCVGSSSTFSSTVSGGIWSSSNPSVLAISPGSGQVTALSVGSAIVIYSVSGVGVCPSSQAFRLVAVSAPSQAGVISGLDSICLGDTIPYSASVGGGIWSSSNPSVLSVVQGTGQATGLSSGIADLIYSVSGIGGCTSAYSSFRVVVTAPVQPGLLFGADSLCVGASYLFTSSVFGGIWSGSDSTVLRVSPTTGQVIALSAGSAEVRYTIMGSGGCQTVQAFRRVVISARPNAPIIFLSINSDSLYSNTSMGNRWFRDGLHLPLYNDSGYIVNPPNGNYRCIRADLLNCESDSSNSVVLLNSDVQYVAHDLIRVIPNPNSGEFELNVDYVGGQIVDVVLINSIGSRCDIVVETKADFPKSYRVRVKSPKSGVYFLYVIFRDGVFDFSKVLIL
jgi:uncharacterized protein YjdB